MEPVDFETFCSDSQLLDEPISKPWAVTFKALDGLPLTHDELPIWRQLTGLDAYQPRQRHQLCAMKGRRAQGTKTGLKYLLHSAHTINFQQYAPRGERLFVPIILQNRDIAREVMTTLAGFYSRSSVLAAEVLEIYRTEVALRNGIVFSVATCSYRAPRGFSAPLGMCDELGIWRQTGSDVDREVIRSLTPAQVQFPNRKLILLGTPWVRAGVLFERWERRFENNDCLFVHAPTPLMNPLIPAEELEKERTADPQNYAREFEATWSTELDQFLPDTDIVAATYDWRELPPSEALPYAAALDASGLSGGDRFTFGVAHGGEGGVVVDLLRGWRRAAVPQVCDEIAGLCKLYRVRKVVADQYSFVFLSELMRQRDVGLEQLAFTARSKPELYFDLKNALAQGRLQLPDHPEALRELRALESLRTTGGNYKIGAPRGQHDDFVTVLALLANRLKRTSAQSLEGFNVFVQYNSGPAPDAPLTEEERLLKERLWEERCFSSRRSSLLR